jgi:hypothetical protein
MALSNRLSSSYRPLLVVVFSLLLVSAYVVNAQNTNNPNTSNVNSAATTTTNANANSNANTNTNTNANQNTKGTDPNATPTPSPTPDLKTKLVESTWYPLVISVIFGGLIIGFAATIMRVILRSKSSFRSPLGLPDGSLRAVLAFLLVAFLGFYVYASVLSLTPFNLPESLLGIIATVIGFYFGSRSAEAAAGGTTSGRTGSVEGTVVDSAGSPAGGATVELSQAGVKKLTQTANPSGKFHFDNVPIGDYDIQASKTGSAPSDSAKVKVTAGGTQTVNLKLK